MGCDLLHQMSSLCDKSYPCDDVVFVCLFVGSTLVKKTIHQMVKCSCDEVCVVI